MISTNDIYSGLSWILKHKIIKYMMTQEKCLGKYAKKKKNTNYQEMCMITLISICKIFIKYYPWKMDKNKKTMAFSMYV